MQHSATDVECFTEQLHNTRENVSIIIIIIVIIVVLVVVVVVVVRSSSDRRCLIVVVIMSLSSLVDITKYLFEK